MYMFSASPTQRRFLLPEQPESNPEQRDTCLERSGVIPVRFVREHTLVIYRCWIRLPLFPIRVQHLPSQAAYIRLVMQ